MLSRTYHYDQYHVYLEVFPTAKDDKGEDEPQTFAYSLVKPKDVCPEMFDPKATTTLVAKIAARSNDEAKEMFQKWQEEHPEPPSTCSSIVPTRF